MEHPAGLKAYYRMGLQVAGETNQYHYGPGGIMVTPATLLPEKGLPPLPRFLQERSVTHCNNLIRRTAHGIIALVDTAGRLPRYRVES